jgi:hypothetical protein
MINQGITSCLCSEHACETRRSREGSERITLSSSIYIHQSSINLFSQQLKFMNEFL